MPSNAPQTVRESSITAGRRPVACPIILGVRNPSKMTWITQNTTIIHITIIQKPVPPCDDCTKATIMGGMIPSVCMYGIMFNNPTNIPIATLIGNPSMANPMENKMPTMREISACLLK